MLVPTKSPLNLLPEAVHSIHRSRFMVPSEQKEIARVLDFVAEEQSDRLQVFGSTVDVIYEKLI